MQNRSFVVAVIVGLVFVSASILGGAYLAKNGVTGTATPPQPARQDTISRSDFEDLKTKFEALQKKAWEGPPAPQVSVPLGAMIPYFGAGDEPPKGYVWADGAAVLAATTRGSRPSSRDRSGENKEVPDMRHDSLPAEPRMRLAWAAF